ncbi:MAG: M20 family metallopeptidase [Eubacteriales bacterium]|nr:M20 family metallopeptidase [Eubacteriales bacterium]
MTDMENAGEKWGEASWELAKELIRIDSTDPGAFEGEIEAFMEGRLRESIRRRAGEMGEQITLEKREVLPGRFNLRARIPGRTDGPELIYICHMDTVVEGEGWSEGLSPFGAVVRQDRLYGRGACDMKSGLACAVTAFESMVEETGKRGRFPERGFSLILTVDEEDFMRGAEDVIQAGWVRPEDWLLDTEPTDGRIQASHKGRTWFLLTIEGITAHASNPWKGADAVAAMAEVIRHMRKAFQQLPVHQELGASTITFGQIAGGYRPYVVPDRCQVWIDMRLVPPADTSLAEKIAREAIQRAAEEIPGIKGDVQVTGDRPWIVKDPDAPLLAALKDACRDVTGQEPEEAPFNGYTDTAVIGGRLKVPSAMSYGPGSLELAHKPDEWVPKKDVERVEQVLTVLAGRALWE